MENLTEYKIKLPTLPDGFEADGFGLPKKGDTYLNDYGSWQVATSDFLHTYCVTARRRETLADWANKQRLFQALAEMRKGVDWHTTITHEKNSMWMLLSMSLDLGIPPANLTGKLRLEAGKWVDA